MVIYSKFHASTVTSLVMPPGYIAGNTPLHIASGRKMKDIVAVLMAYGANPGIANYEGDLPSGLPPPSLVVRSIPIFVNYLVFYNYSIHRWPE